MPACAGLGASLRNCCSGKHAGFMTPAKDQGVDVAGYIQREHPVQQQIEATIGEVLDTPVGVFGVDGCGIQTYANRLMDLAKGLHRLASATGVRGDAVKTLAAAHRAHPFMVGGTDRCCTDINGALADGMVKYGAEGVYFGLFPKAGLGIAMKAECGTVRAVEVAMVRVLKQHGLLPADALPQWDSVSLKTEPVWWWANSATRFARRASGLPSPAASCTLGGRRATPSEANPVSSLPL